MMNLKHMMESLNATALAVPAGWEGRGVQGVFVSDLISDILVSDGDQILLVTSLLSDQVLKTADVIGAAGVVLAHRRYIPEVLLKVASGLGLPLFQTPLSKFETCVRLGRLLEAR